PVERVRHPESRRLRPDREAPLVVGDPTFRGVVDDFRYSGVHVGEPIKLPDGVQIVGDSRTIRFESGRLDAEAHRVVASGTYRWHNRSRVPIDTVPMHLYLNGFRAEDTAWMRDGRLSGRTAAQGGDKPWGYIDVLGVWTRPDPAGERVALRFAERDEPSLMDVTLPEAVPPGGSVALELSFETQLPHVFARSGYHDDFHMVAQWFPKPGVLRPDGVWDAHPFTFHSEFYADFADYTVELDVPYTMAVGATGTRLSEETEGDRRTLRYRAEAVHDFAWAAGPDLVVQTREDEGISIRQLMPPGRAPDGAAHLDMAVATLQHMQRRFTPYPWSTLTIIHPPPGAAGAGGMEYPTLFTTGDKTAIPGWAERLGFEERFSGRYVTAHELGHQWFQGLLASNEFAQPWLDEGLNSYSNLMVYFDHYADESIAGEDVWVASLAGHRLTLGDGLRLRQRWRAPNADISDQSAATFSPLFAEYGAVTYRRTSAWMATLRALAGRERFDAAMHTYAERFRFRHPEGADLEAALVEGLGATFPVSEPDASEAVITVDVRRFLEQALRSTAVVDFDVSRIEIVPKMSDPPAGYRRVDGALVGGDAPTGRSRAAMRERPDEEVESLIVIRRRGDFKVPVVVQVDTTASVERYVWSGEARATTLRLPGVRVRSVVLDPDGDLYLEGRRLNNTAFARDVVPVRALPEALGEVTEAAALAVMGGLGP
ncbi:MAG: M1 family metallopeptidase, partial [Myxococcota bacterium]